MKTSCSILLCTFLLAAFTTYSQTTDIVILNAAEASRLQTVIATNEQAKLHYDTIVQRATLYLDDQPRPLKKLYYEGLLDNNPDRVDTEKSLADMDKVVDFIYTSYGDSQEVYGRKAKQMVMAWAETYEPTGNPINENKFNALFWAYYLFQKEFSRKEKKTVENWMVQIAKAQMDRTRTPNNNWEAKRQKIIGTVGCITENKDMIDFSVNGFQEYIGSAYYADGTSNDLKERDALHYHVSGLKPAIAFFINCTPFNAAFDLYGYTAPAGASISKAVEYVVPYATGEKQRKEWVNSKAAIDKKRAAAGLEKYQPGMLFNPEQALSLFEWACYYNPDWYGLSSEDTAKSNYTATWIGLLNSPLVRKE